MSFSCKFYVTNLLVILKWGYTKEDISTFLLLKIIVLHMFLLGNILFCMNKCNVMKNLDF